MCRRGLSPLINVGVVTGNSEVIGIGVGEKVVELRECGDKEVEKGRGYKFALRDPYPGIKRWGEGKVLSATGGSPF